MQHPVAAVYVEQIDDALSPEDIDELLRRAAAAEEAERRGETIALEDLINEVDQIGHGSVSD